MGRQLNLPHGTKNRKRSSHKVHGVGPEAGRKSMVGKICERGSFEPGVKEWRVLDGESGESTKGEEVVGGGTGKSETERLG